MNTLLISWALALPLFPPSQLEPAYQDGELVLEDAAGAWNVLGYGNIMSFTADGPRAFTVTSSLGWEVTEILEFEPSDVWLGPLGADGRRNFASGVGETPYVIERLEEIPARCLAPIEWTSTELFQAFEETMTERYAFFEARGFDWESRVKAARAEVSEGMAEEELALLMAGCLEGLGDGHVSFEAEVDGEEIELDSPSPRLLQRAEEEVERAAEAAGEEPTEDDLDARLGALMASLQGGVRDGILAGKGDFSGEPFKWGRVDGNIGYVLITGMGLEDAETLEEMVSSVHASLDEILKGLAGVEAIVLDISLNGGGTDGVSHAIASHFTDKRRLAYTKGPSAVPDIRHEVFIEPWSGERFLGPVYVVSSDITASAAEIFQLCCRVLPNVQLVGTTGSKIFSDVIEKPLPNGWWLTISAETYLTPDGECFEGVGVPVEIPLPIFEGENLGNSHRDAILGFLKTLRE